MSALQAKAFQTLYFSEQQMGQFPPTNGNQPVIGQSLTHYSPMLLFYTP